MPIHLAIFNVKGNCIIAVITLYELNGESIS